MDRVQPSQGYSFLGISGIYLIAHGRASSWVDLRAPISFEPRTPGMEIQRPNHKVLGAVLLKW